MKNNQILRSGGSACAQAQCQTNPSNAIAQILTSLLLALAIPYQLDAAGPAPVNLLSTAPFVILAGAAVTTTGGGIINGDVGASPIAGSAIGVTCAQVNGTIYAVDASGPPCAQIEPTLLTTAKNDLMTAMTTTAGLPNPTEVNPGGGNLGGLSLAPGLYKITTTTLITGSNLTLAGTGANDDVWIFQCAQDLQLGSGIKVILTGGAQAQNIFWQVGTSAVLGTFSVFNGTILASQAITMNTSSTMNGRALAFTAGVTFNGNGATVPGTTNAAGIVTNATGIAVQQPLGTSLTNGVVTNDFGSWAVGTSTNVTFTITNTGTANLTISGITIAGSNSTLFTVIAPPAASVSPSNTTTFTVRFAPVSSGVQTAVLDIANNDIANNNNPFIIALTGTGTGTGVVPGIVVQQPSGTNLVNGVGTNNFGLAAVGTSTSLTFTITNIGSSNLTVSGITIGGVNSNSFTVTNFTTATVSPSGSTNFTVRFAPVSTNLQTAVLHIVNNDIYNSPFNIALAGTGMDSAIIVSTNVSVYTNSAGNPSVLMLDPQTGLFTNSIILTNSSTNTIPAVRLYILNLVTNAQVYYKSGTTTNGTPYVQEDNFPLAPGATVDFTIEYYQATHQGIPIPTYVAQDLTNAVTLTVTTNSAVAFDRWSGESGGGMLIGFYTTPGRKYAVQYYSSDTTNWLTADPLIIAPINYVQWIDFGAPKTHSPLPPPFSRFYRVFEQ
jgi:hypothetical protein